MKRIVLHLDMDAFFAAVEERENPQFRGKPVVVGADPKAGKGRGVVSTCNYLARKYGIHSALPISRAYQLCPSAIFLPVNMELYERVSERIMEIIKKYSPVFEQVSLDEAYLDLSFLIPETKTKTCSQFRRSLELVTREDLGKEHKRAELLAKKLKEEIFEKEKLTSTIGIGPNKLIAKMATNKAKPGSRILTCSTESGTKKGEALSKFHYRAKPDGLLVIKQNQVKSFLEPLDIEEIPGIGPKTAEKLRAIKVNKIEELKKLSWKKLKNMFGIVGETIYDRARGIDEEPVSSEGIIKSIGREHTFEKDTRDPEIIFRTFEEIIGDVHQEILANKFSFKTITVICRFTGFETHSKSKTLKEPTNNFEILRKESKKLLLKFLIESSKLIRLIGLRVSRLE